MVLYINILYNIVQKYKALEKNIKQLIMLIIIVLVFVIGTSFLKNMSNINYYRWNYKKINSAEDVLDKGKVISDRKLYWQLKDIIYNFLYTMEDTNFYDKNYNQENITYLDYYKVLTKKYQRQMNEDIYKEKASEFINRFMLEDHLEHKQVSDFVIDCIYKYNDDMYLCLVYSEGNNRSGYIGIKLSQADSIFEIFYIE